MNKAIFLDRDGVINREIGRYVTSEAEFELLPNIGKNLYALQQAGYMLIVVTNQAGIAKNLYSHEVLADIHKKMTDELAEAGVQITEIYYAPQHVAYSSQSLSRKPNSLMIEKAMARFNISPNNSYLIGDKPRDIEAGESAGLKACFLINSNEGLEHIVFDILNK